MITNQSPLLDQAALNCTLAQIIDGETPVYREHVYHVLSYISERSEEYPNATISSLKVPLTDFGKSLCSDLDVSTLVNHINTITKIACSTQSTLMDFIQNQSNVYDPNAERIANDSNFIFEFDGHLQRFFDVHANGCPVDAPFPTEQRFYCKTDYYQPRAAGGLDALKKAFIPSSN